MRMLTMTLALLMLALGTHAFGQTRYHADFSSITSTSAECEDVFSRLDYEVSMHFLNNPRAAVMHFEKSTDEREGFFKEMTLVGRRGYDEIVFKKEWKPTATEHYVIHANGVAEQQFILFWFTVDRIHPSTNDGSDPDVICTAKADFYGVR
jgi:hypothetical protein